MGTMFLSSSNFPLRNFIFLFIFSTLTHTTFSQNSISQDEASIPTVETPLGTINGFEQTLFGKTVDTYLGIPFAEPPVGELRFKKPIPAKPRGIINATAFSPSCSAFDPFHKSPQSEDCLYLNIWKPACSDNTLKPVMVWIHGGGFIFGSANFPFYNGLALAAYGDVVVVSMNYRLASLGFLNLGGVDGVRGNAGMHDQVLALQWIKNNIRLFGGDPSLITIFGESAGGCSVGYHLVSPLSRNLFTRAIMQSGSTDCDLGGMKKKSDTSYSWRFAKELGCAPDDANLSSENGNRPEGTLRCLQEVAIEKILATATKFLQENIFGAFTVTVDGEFLPDVAAKLLERGEIGDQLKEVMTGVTSDEGSPFLPFSLPNQFGDETPNLTDDVAKELMKQFIGPITDTETSKEALKLYFEKYNGPLNYKAFYEAYGDVLLTCPVIFTAEKVASHGRKVYFYEFAYRYPKLQLHLETFTGPEWAGVPHFQEVGFVFGVPLMEKGHTEVAADLSKRVMTIWTTFAKTGKPSDQMGKEWPLFSREEPTYLKILPNEAPEASGHHQESCELWRRFYKRKWESLSSNKT